MKDMLMRRAVLITTIVGSILALIYLLEALRYPFGTLAAPSAGLYPLVVGLFLLVGFVGAAIETIGTNSQERIAWPRGAERNRVLAIALASAGYIVILPYLGHAIASSLIAFVVLHAMNVPSLRLKIVMALLAGVGSYYLFSTLLGIHLLPGKWFD